MIASGHGKAILLGEHAVVEGAPALVAAIPQGVIATCIDPQAAPDARPDEAGLPLPLQVEVPAWDLTARRNAPGLFGEALEALAKALVGAGLPEDALGGTLRIDARIPARAGVGSSAALAVAITRALFARAGASELASAESPEDQATIEAIVGQSEAVFHGRPSGVDAAIATRGGVGTFRPGVGLLPCPPGTPFALVLAHTGPKPPTRDAVDHVRARCRASAEARRSLQRLGDLAETGAGLLQAGDLEALGEAMNEAHAQLGALRLCTPALDAAVRAARAAGALGAKLTGAGGGGCVVALCHPEHVDPVTREAQIRSPWVGTFHSEEMR